LLKDKTDKLKLNKLKGGSFVGYHKSANTVKAVRERRNVLGAPALQAKSLKKEAFARGYIPSLPRREPLH